MQASALVLTVILLRFCTAAVLVVLLMLTPVKFTRNRSELFLFRLKIQESAVLLVPFGVGKAAV